MECGQYADGRALNYDDDVRQFDVGGTPVTLQQVIEYDKAGQVMWANEELRRWAYEGYEQMRRADKGHAKEVRGAERRAWFKSKQEDHALRSAEKQYQHVMQAGYRRLGGYDGLGLFEDRVETPQGVLWFKDGPVNATVDSEGSLTEDRRVTLTRVALIGLFALAAPKKSKRDTRELYLLVQGPSMAGMVACKPEDSWSVRQLAVTIGNASQNYEQAKARREQEIAEAEDRIRRARADHESAQEALQKELEEVRR